MAKKEIKTTSVAKKFTFKTEKANGRYAAFFDDTINIKFGGKNVGVITHHPPHNLRFMVYKNENNTDNNKNCEWRWITLNKEFSSIADAKEFVNNHFEAITTKYKLHGN